jgi:hypothetical protein
MQRDPIGEVKALYAWLGNPVTDEFEAAMNQWWQQNLESREPSTPADPATFNLDIEQIRPLFADYTARATVWTRRKGTAHVH